MGKRVSAIASARWRVDRKDLVVIGGLYVAIVALFRVAFTVFTADRVAGLFLSFGAARLIGVAGPVVYTVWVRRRPLASLGIGLHDLKGRRREADQDPDGEARNQRTDHGRPASVDRAIAGVTGAITL